MKLLEQSGLHHRLDRFESLNERNLAQMKKKWNLPRRLMPLLCKSFGITELCSTPPLFLAMMRTRLTRLILPSILLSAPGFIWPTSTLGRPCRGRLNDRLQAKSGSFTTAGGCSPTIVTARHLSPPPDDRRPTAEGVFGRGVNLIPTIPSSNALSISKVTA